jgi:hypothetical protein
MNIFNIQTEYQLLVNELIENGGELTPELELALQINKDNFHSKSENYAYITKQYDAEMDIIDNEIKRLQQAKKSREKTIQRLKDTIELAMLTFDIDKIETPLIKISFRKSESVEVSDVNDLPNEFKVIKLTETADKLKIKDALKSGMFISGCSIKSNRNLQIK